jgi:hypothetical protein
MEKALFFLGKWKGLGKVVEKSMPYLEEASFEVFKTSPVTIITYQH